MKDHREDAYRPITIRSELLHGIRHGTLSRRDMHKKLLLASGAPAVMSQFEGGEQVRANAAQDSSAGQGADAHVGGLRHITASSFLPATQG